MLPLFINLLFRSDGVSKSGTPVRFFVSHVTVSLRQTHTAPAWRSRGNESIAGLVPDCYTASQSIRSVDGRTVLSSCAGQLFIIFCHKKRRLFAQWFSRWDIGATWRPCLCPLRWGRHNGVYFLYSFGFAYLCICEFNFIPLYFWILYKKERTALPFWLSLCALMFCVYDLHPLRDFNNNCKIVSI